MRRLLEQNNETSVLLRAGSFLQHALNDRIGTDQKLSPVITDAYEEDELSMQQLRLCQFIRHCRNDVSHNFAYHTEWDFAVHDHAALCVMTVLNSLVDSWYGAGFRLRQRLSEERCIRVIEELFGLEWLEEPLTYKKSIHPRYGNQPSRM